MWKIYKYGLCFDPRGISPGLWHLRQNATQQIAQRRGHHFWVMRLGRHNSHQKRAHIARILEQ
jgi:hypothetical protein